jgi:hypothetical protein
MQRRLLFQEPKPEGNTYFFAAYGFAYFNTVDKSIPRMMLSE